MVVETEVAGFQFPAHLVGHQAYAVLPVPHQLQLHRHLDGLAVVGTVAGHDEGRSASAHQRFQHIPGQTEHVAAAQAELLHLFIGDVFLKKF